MVESRAPITFPHPGDKPNYRAVRSLIKCFFEGHGVIVCPSDTCYGIFAAANDEAAVDLVKDLTGRRDDPLPVTVGTVRDAAKLIELDKRHGDFISLAWPGAFLAISKRTRAARKITRCVNPGNDTLGVRVTSDSLEAALSLEAGVAVVSTAVRYPNGDPVRRGADALAIISAAMTMRATAEELVGFVERDTFRYRTHSTVGVLVEDDRVIHVMREGAMPNDVVRTFIRTVKGQQLADNIVAPLISTATRLAWSDPATWEDVT